MCTQVNLLNGLRNFKAPGHRAAAEATPQSAHGCDYGARAGACARHRCLGCVICSGIAFLVCCVQAWSPDQASIQRWQLSQVEAAGANGDSQQIRD